MSAYQNDYNNIFNLLIDIRMDYNPVVDFFGIPMYRVTMPKYRIVGDNIITIKNSDIEDWILKSKNKNRYSHLLKDWKIKQEEKNNIVFITVNDNTFKFNLDEIKLICEMI